jgi:hypothetical protein
MLRAEIGTCLARKYWSSVVKLVIAVDPKIERYDMSGAMTKEAAARREAAAAGEALGEIVPFIASCVPSGTRLRIDRRSLRTIVEEAAYHITAESSLGVSISAKQLIAGPTPTRADHLGKGSLMPERKLR